MNNKPITKAVIPAAGFGTRFLPQTKSMPKELLPIIDKPILQYIVEELVEAGVTDIVIVTSHTKRSIEDYFDKPNADLVTQLEASGKTKQLEELNRVSELANFAYIRQKGPQGNATPLLNAAHLLGNEPFYYVFADDVFVATPSRFEQMKTTYQSHPGIVHSCLEINSNEQFNSYGVVGGKQLKDGLIKINRIVEKPGQKNAPSNLASIGGYIITPDIFPYLQKRLEMHDPKNGEFKIQDAMQDYVDHSGDMYGVKIENAKYYDTGNKLEYLKTVVDFGLNHPDFRDSFRDYLKSLI